MHGPQDAGWSFEMAGDQLGDEAIALDPEYGERLREWQQFDARRNFVRWLAMSPSSWRWVKMGILMYRDDPKKVEQFKYWLRSAKRHREYEIAKSKKDALARRTA